MGMLTGDLSPRASGSAALGVEMINGMGGFTTDIRPYTHVHQNSGVFHGVYGESGVLRLGEKDFECSVDGGLTFGSLPHSGQIQESINQFGSDNASLQTAYELNPYIFTDSTDEGAVKINGSDTVGLQLYQEEDTNTHPHLQLSGILSRIPNVGLNRGSMWMQAHTAGWAGQLGGFGLPATQAEADARSFGPALPFYETGSGVVNFMIASGIGQFVNIGNKTIDPTDGLQLDGLTEHTTDSFYTLVSSSGIRFNVAGAYRISGTAVLLKTAGNLRQSVVASVRVRTFGQEFTFQGAESYVSVRDSDTSATGSVSSVCVADIEVGETLVYDFILLPLVGEKVILDNVIKVVNNGATILVEYLGPKRFGRANRLKRI